MTIGNGAVSAAPIEDFSIETIPGIFFDAIDNRPRPDAMQYHAGDEWRQLSHLDVFDRVSGLASALHNLGIGPGARIAIISENRPEWAIADYATLALGAADVPIYANLPPDQIAYILNDAEVCAIFVSNREQLAKILEIRDEVPSLREVIAFDDPGDAERVRRFDELIASGRSNAPDRAPFDLRARGDAVKPDDLATLIYTSGTTGDPKGVMLTHRNIASNIAAVREHRLLDITPGDVALSFLPLSHSFERTVDYYYWSAGASIAYVSAVELVGESMMQVRPHVLAAAPRVFEKIYAKVMGATGVKRALVLWAKKVGEAAIARRLAGEGPRGVKEKLADRLVFSKLRARTGGRVRAFVSGSAPLSADIARFFWAAGLPVYEGYGLTETSPVLTANRPGGTKLGTVGLPIPGTELRIGNEGEILARGPQIMKGYYNRPDATAETTDADGWFRTGDVGTIDTEGFLSITDRIKNLLVTAGGKNIAPQPIENQAAMSSYVSQVVMLGDRRAFPTLLVVPDIENLKPWASSQGIDTSDPEALARDPRVAALLEKETIGRLEGFARYEMPKKIAVVPRELTVESGELTPTMKVKRRVVEENYRELIEEMYAGS
jgi:long-chain acyl-CoA synthetase